MGGMFLVGPVFGFSAISGSWGLVFFCCKYDIIPAPLIRMRCIDQGLLCTKILKLHCKIESKSCDETSVLR
jgi:hypothetical protein